MSLDGYLGNQNVATTLWSMVETGRVPQTLLFSGPEGVGKSTLARRFGAAILNDTGNLIAQDDLSLEANQTRMADRDKWTSEKRNEDPLVFSSHPDFLTFAPDGPLRQISIHQMRLLKDRASLKPLHGKWRVFLIDGIDRANEQAANSLLKTLEEPPEHLIIVLTTRNAYDLLPTIRSRAIPFAFSRLTPEQMKSFVELRKLDQAAKRVTLADGAPGIAVTLDLEVYDRRRLAMLALLKVSANLEPFGAWMKHADSIAARRTEKLESYVEVLYGLLGDVLRVAHGGSFVRNSDIRSEIESLARKVSFAWLRRATARCDELVEMGRRNIQKGPAFDAFAAALRMA